MNFNIEHKTGIDQLIIRFPCKIQTVIFQIKSYVWQVVSQEQLETCFHFNFVPDGGLEEKAKNLRFIPLSHLFFPNSSPESLSLPPFLYSEDCWGRRRAGGEGGDRG